MKTIFGLLLQGKDSEHLTRPDLKALEAHCQNLLDEADLPLEHHFQLLSLSNDSNWQKHKAALAQTDLRYLNLKIGNATSPLAFQLEVLNRYLDLQQIEIGKEDLMLFVPHARPVRNRCLARLAENRLVENVVLQKRALYHSHKETLQQQLFEFYSERVREYIEEVNTIQVFIISQKASEAIPAFEEKYQSRNWENLEKRLNYQIKMYRRVCKLRTKIHYLTIDKALEEVLLRKDDYLRHHYCQDDWSASRKPTYLHHKIQEYLEATLEYVQDDVAKKFIAQFVLKPSLYPLSMQELIADRSENKAIIITPEFALDQNINLQNRNIISLIPAANLEENLPKHIEQMLGTLSEDAALYQKQIRDTPTHFLSQKLRGDIQALREKLHLTQTEQDREYLQFLINTLRKLFIQTFRYDCIIEDKDKAQNHNFPPTTLRFKSAEAQNLYFEALANMLERGKRADIDTIDTSIKSEALNFILKDNTSKELQHLLNIHLEVIATFLEVYAPQNLETFSSGMIEMLLNPFEGLKKQEILKALSEIEQKIQNANTIGERSMYELMKASIKPLASQVLVYSSIKIQTNDIIIYDADPQREVRFERAQERAIYFYFLYRRIKALSPISLDTLQGKNVLKTLDTIYQNIPDNRGRFTFPKQINSSISHINSKFKKHFPKGLYERYCIQKVSQNGVNLYGISLDVEKIRWEENSSFGLFMRSQGYK